MATKSLKSYIKDLKEKCETLFGVEFVLTNEDLIECTARNKKLLERFDEEICNGDLTTVTSGSMGQTKEEINPLIKHRNDIAKLYADNLDALQLSPRSKYKKTEGKSEIDQNDGLVQFYNK